MLALPFVSYPFGNPPWVGGSLEREFFDLMSEYRRQYRTVRGEGAVPPLT